MARESGMLYPVASTNSTVVATVMPSSRRTRTRARASPMSSARPNDQGVTSKSSTTTKDSMMPSPTVITVCRPRHIVR